MKVANERSSLTKSVVKSKIAGRHAATKYGSTNDRKMVDTVITKEKYRKFHEDDMHYNYEADLMLDSVNRRYKRIVLTTYFIGMAMAFGGCLLALC